jgi:sensor histidine kinase regulating citrate/malate metabolism
LDHYEELKKQFNKALEEVDIYIPKIENFETGKYKENIQKFIYNRQSFHKSKTKLILDIKWYGKHANVPIATMMKMLGTLLDNAMATKTKKPIFVRMTVVNSILEITVENESDDKSPIEIDDMFNEGYSTKKGSRGYGLPNLAKSVKNYHGDIITSCEYRNEYKAYYLSLTVEIKAK